MTEEPKRLKVSAAPEPIKPISGWAKYGVPPNLPKSERPQPSGYIAFPKIMHWIAVSRLAFGLTHSIARMSDFEDRDAEERIKLLERWTQSKDDREHVSRHIQQLLIDGPLQAVGIVRGELKTIPKEAWLYIYAGERERSKLAAIEYAFAGEEIRVQAPRGGEWRAYPMLVARQLAEVFGATQLPSAPSVLPFGMEVSTDHAADRVTTTDATSEKIVDGGESTVHEAVPPPQGLAVRLADWMDGHAMGFKRSGGIVKREDAINAAKSHFRCTYVQAERAYEALSWPEKRNPPRTGKI